MAMFTPQRQSLVDIAETTWTAKSEVCAVCPFTENAYKHIIYVVIFLVK